MPVLYRLLWQGCISEGKVLVGKRARRIYHHLELVGEIYWRGLMEEYTAVTEGVIHTTIR